MVDLIRKQINWFTSFNSSLAFDQRLYHYDIMGSMVHVEMLVKQGILKKQRKERIIINGLKEIEEEIEEGDINNLIILMKISILL